MAEQVMNGTSRDRERGEKRRKGEARKGVEPPAALAAGLPSPTPHLESAGNRRPRRCSDSTQAALMRTAREARWTRHRVPGD